MAKKIKHFFIRNYHLLFSECMTINFEKCYFTFGEIVVTGTTKSKLKYLGNNWFLILKDNG